MRKIVLVGYMAVGKTTIAKLLAEKIKMDWIDLDEMIENQTNLSISDLFREKGEIYFRKLEHDLFKKTLASDKDTIISTGGGTPCYANNHLLLNDDHTISIYLKASIDTIFERLKNDNDNRPLVADQSDEEMKEFIAKHLFDRSFFYNQTTYKVTIDNKSPEDIVAEIMVLLPELY